MNFKLVPLGALSIVALAAMFGLTTQSPTSAASYIDMRIIGGIATNDMYAYPHADPCGTDYWHCDEAMAAQVALDLIPSDGDYAKNVWFQSWSASGSGYAYAVVSHAPAGNCPAARVQMWVPYPNSSSGTWVGWENYVQITPTIAHGTTFYTSSYGWTLVNLGPIHTDWENPPCALWEGPHLHQSGGTGPNIYTNWALNDDNGGSWGLGIYPASDTNYNFLHQVYY
jgi:hypothetical protein